MADFADVADVGDVGAVGEEAPPATPGVDDEASGGAGTVYLLRDPPVLDPERVAKLAATKPSGSASDLAKVRDTMMAIVVGLAFKSLARDKYLYLRGIAFALFCLWHGPDGRFVAERDLREAVFEYYVNHPSAGIKPGTRATYMSSLRLLAGSPGRYRKGGFPRTAGDPYSSQTRNRMWAVASAMEADLVNQPRRQGRGLDTMTLLAGGFGLGLIRGEINYLRADSVTGYPDKVVVQVARHGWVRDVPVYGATADHLRTRAASLKPTDWLFRPSHSHRHNVVADLVFALKNDYPIFDGYTTERARYRLLIDLLVGGCPFHVLCAVAGIGPSTKRPTDLLPFMPSLTPDEVVAAMDRFTGFRGRAVDSPAANGHGGSKGTSPWLL